MALIKCSRGSINVAIQSIEGCGEAADSNDENERRTQLLRWITDLQEKAREVGDGMTELGTCMYPPMGLDNLRTQIQSQRDAMLALHDQILDQPPPPPPVDMIKPETVELSRNIQKAIAKRSSEALEALETLKQTQSG